MFEGGARWPKRAGRRFRIKTEPLEARQQLVPRLLESKQQMKNGHRDVNIQAVLGRIESYATYKIGIIVIVII